MIGRGSQFEQAVSAERAARGLSQAALAELVGCSQSQISRIESGRLGEVATQVLEAVARELDLQVAAPERPTRLGRTTLVSKVCRDAACRSNVPDRRPDGLLVFVPRTVKRKHGATFCSDCGSAQTSKCPACDEPVAPGSHCQSCGAPYVPVPKWLGVEHVDGEDVERWCRERRAELDQIARLTGGSGDG